MSTVRRSFVLAPVALAAFITSLDNTVVNAALIVIQRQFGFSLTGLEWVATCYVLSFSTLTLAGGRLTDLYGRRRVFVAGMTIFLAASALAGAAPTGSVLLAARVLQGCGGALVLPATLAVLASDLDDARSRQVGAGIWTAAVGAALACGPVVGGYLSQQLSWRWIFFINLPTGLVALILGLVGTAHSGADRRPGSGESLDLPGLVCSGIALLALTFGLIQGNETGFGSTPILLAFCVAAAAGLAFVLVEGSSPSPMVDVSLLGNRMFAGASAAQVLWGLGINGVFFFTSLYLQLVLGFSPTRAGATFIPLALVLVVLVPVAPRIARALGVHITAALGLAIVAGGLLLVSRIGPGARFVDLLPGLGAVGIGSALTTPLVSAVLEVVPESDAGMASALVSTAREVSGVLGVALTGAILLSRRHRLAAAGANPVAAFAGGYALALRYAALMVLLGAVVCLVALRPGGQVVSPATREHEGEADEQRGGLRPPRWTADDLADRRISFPPVIRPAIWDPVRSVTVPTRPTSGAARSGQARRRLLPEPPAVPAARERRADHVGGLASEARPTVGLRFSHGPDRKAADGRPEPGHRDRRTDVLPDTVRVRFPGGAFSPAGAEVAGPRPGAADGLERDGITVTTAAEDPGAPLSRWPASTDHHQPGVVDESFDVRLVRGEAPPESGDGPRPY